MLNWQKSTYSGGGDGNHCVELATSSNEIVLLREGDEPDTIVSTTPIALEQFMQKISTKDINLH